jgi:uncharacterized protein
MYTQAIIGKTAEHVRAKFSGESSGHDWWHVHRVWKTAVRIGTSEKADLFVVELAALLHDIADWKFHNGDIAAGPLAARAWLENLGVEESVIGHVCQIIQDISFKGEGVPTPMRSREGMVVQDADRLDAMGAIGIARAFAYGGYKQREIFDPAVPLKHHATFEEYRSTTGTTINHFYEKLLLLKSLMNTSAGKTMAEKRHAFMQHYLERFFLEWEGKE